MRIQKYLSQKGVLSRREAEKYMKAGLVMLNGEVVRDLGRQMDPEKDKVEILKSAKKEIGEKITVAVNKPRGIICRPAFAKAPARQGKTPEGESEILRPIRQVRQAHCRQAQGRQAQGKILRQAENKTIFDLFPQFKNLNTVGRLDKESEGLILLSNDGVITRAVTGEHNIEKEYRVQVREEIRPRHIKKLEEGILLEDGMTLPAKAGLISKNEFSLILNEGKKHQIRRMANAIYLTIVKLRRVRIGIITLKGVAPGKYRLLTKNEIESLKNFRN